MKKSKSQKPKRNKKYKPKKRPKPNSQPINRAQETLKVINHIKKKLEEKSIKEDSIK